MTQYISRTTWDSVPEMDRRPDRVDHICDLVLRSQDMVYVSELGEVEGWLSSGGLPTLRVTIVATLPTFGRGIGGVS